MTTFSEDELVVQVRQLSVQRLHRWIRLGWVRPDRVEGAAVFDDVDVARVRLLHDLEHEMEFDEDTVPLLLSLLDQIHGLRNELKSLVSAVDQQPQDIRERIRTAYRRFAES